MGRKIRTQLKLFIGVIAIVFCALCMQHPAYAKWVEETSDWRWQDETGEFVHGGWKYINEKWYYFDTEGYMQTGWLQLDGIWYYLKPTGEMAANEWVGDYYLQSDGSMATNCWIGAWYVGPDGKWISGYKIGHWIKSGNRWWYRHTDGSYPCGTWKPIDGKWYYFNESGWMVADEWVGDYYLSQTGEMAVNQWIGEYYVGEDGKWIPYYDGIHPYAPEWVLIQYADMSGNQAMFYTLKNLENGTLIVIDGGWSVNADAVRDVITENGGTVEAWILTHFHGDHIGAFNDIYSNPQGIEIKNIYAPPLDANVFHSVAKWWDTPEDFDRFLELTAEEDNVTYINRDDCLTIDGLSITFFNSYGEHLRLNGDIPNNTSLVYKVETTEDSVLFCGDCCSTYLADELLSRYGDKLQAKYVQPGHHGNNSIPTYFYDVVNPDYAFFDAPDWLMTSDTYTAKKLAAYFETHGVQVYDYRTAPNVVGLY